MTGVYIILHVYFCNVRSSPHTVFSFLTFIYIRNEEYNIAPEVVGLQLSSALGSRINVESLLDVAFQHLEVHTFPIPTVYCSGINPSAAKFIYQINRFGSNIILLSSITTFIC